MQFEEQILLFNKPYRWTSFDVVRKVKGAMISSLKKQSTNPDEYIRLKIGHAGTLDPLATGLLVICTGSFTKKIHEIQDAQKEYEGIMYLGATTASYDLESEIIHHASVKEMDSLLIDETVKQFIGRQNQTPPAFSAVKVGGKRAYHIARSGKTPDIKAKEIEISLFELTKINLPEIHFRVICSKGTYIRTLVHDFGQKLGTGAYLSALCRTRIGNYELKNALDPEKFSLQMAEIQ